MKLKTKKAAAKRFRFTATGKIKCQSAGLRHNLGNKSRKQKRRKSDPATIIFVGDVKHIEKCLPYGTK